VICPAVVTGGQFLVRVLLHLDCQAQNLGNYGFEALAEPGSPAMLALTALLTIFVALYGVRLLFGHSDEPRSVANALLKVGIVLTIAMSGPAWRTVAYRMVFDAPAEVATSLLPPTMAYPLNSFPQRLQNIDAGIAALTVTGTGRQTGRVIGGTGLDGFRAIALGDMVGLGWARSLYLASTIGALATLRISGGLLLALTPLMAGLLLFNFTRGIFSGWLRGLVVVGLGSLGVTVLFAIQIAIMEPLLEGILSRRGLGYATPTAPTEVLAIVIGFCVATLCIMFVLIKVAFQNSWTIDYFSIDRSPQMGFALSSNPSPGHAFESPREVTIKEGTVTSIQRGIEPETGVDASRRITLRAGGDMPRDGEAATVPNVPLGSSYRRPLEWNSRSQQERNSRGQPR